MSIKDIIKQSRPLLNEQVELMLEGKMEDELVAQLGKWYKTKHRTRDLDDTQKDEISVLAKSILDVDPTKRKSWRFKIKEWILSGEIHLPKDTNYLSKALKMHMSYHVEKHDFNSMSELLDFVNNITTNRGAVDEMFNYEFKIDYHDKRFIIYKIEEKDRDAFIAKLGAPCTTWCVSDEIGFGMQRLPYYLLVDKNEKKQYAAVPTAGQFRDSKQNVTNSEKKFEEFDRLLDLRHKYYYDMVPMLLGEVYDGYIYSQLEPSIQMKFVKSDIQLAGDIEHPTEEVQLYVIDKVPTRFKDLNNPSEAIQVSIVSKFGLNIEHIENPSEDVQLAAVEKSGIAIQYIKNPSEDVQIAAVTRSGHALNYINNPSEKIQLAAVERSKKAIGYISNPSDIVVAKHQEKWGSV
jgi:hypothetical protein